MPASHPPSLDPWESVAVNVRHADIFPCERDWELKPFTPSFDCLFYIQKGYGWVSRDGHRLEARPGDLFIWRSGHHYRAGHDPKRPFTVLSTGFYLHRPASVSPLRYFALPDRLRLNPKAARAIEKSYKELIAEYRDSTIQGQLAARGALLGLLSQTLRWVERLPAPRKAGHTGPAPGEWTRIAAVLEYIDRNVAQRFTLGTLARKTHLSPVYFASLFRRHVGTSPMAFVRRRRIEIACSLLASGDAGVGEVAHAVGFVDPYYFSRVFKQIMGISPRDYRESFKNPFIG